MIKQLIKKEKPSNLVQTIERMALILETLGQFPHGLSLGDLSEKVSLPKGTTHRLLTSMAYFDFVRQNHINKHYHLGFKLVELGNNLLSHIDLRNEAHPHLLKLSENVQETVHLVILDNEEALYIDKVNLYSRRGGLQMVSSLGSRIPLYCSAVGKVLLAFMPAAAAEAIIQKTDFVRLSKNTITTPDELKLCLQEVKSAGYAIDDEENEEGVCCIAAPIRDETGQVVAAMSVSVPTSRMSMEQIIASLKPQVMETTANISHRLGFV